MLAEHVGDGEHHVGCGDALGDGAGELEPDDAWHEHGNRLAEHRGFGFDAADTPAEHAEAVDGGGVRIRTNAGVEIGKLAAVTQAGVFAHHDFGKIFDVHLVDDAGSRRHHAEVLERLLAPAQELVAFPVALVFDIHVLLQRVGDTVLIDLHGMVDNHVRRHLRVDDLRIAAKLLDCVTHSRQVDDAGHTGEILHDHARRRELNLMARLGLRIPVEQRLDMLVGDVFAVDVAHKVLDEHLERVRQMLDAGQICDIDVVECGVAHGQCGQLTVFE